MAAFPNQKYVLWQDNLKQSTNLPRTTVMSDGSNIP